MDGCSGKEVIQQPHLLRKFRLSQYPAATKAAKPKRFSQAVGNYKLTSQVEGRSRCTFEKSLKVNLVNQNSRTYATSDLTNCTRSFIAGQDSARVMQIR